MAYVGVEWAAFGGSYINSNQKPKYTEVTRLKSYSTLKVMRNAHTSTEVTRLEAQRQNKCRESAKTFPSTVQQPVDKATVQQPASQKVIPEATWFQAPKRNKGKQKLSLSGQQSKGTSSSLQRVISGSVPLPTTNQFSALLVSSSSPVSIPILEKKSPSLGIGVSVHPEDVSVSYAVPEGTPSISFLKPRLEMHTSLGVGEIPCGVLASANSSLIHISGSKRLQEKSRSSSQRGDSDEELIYVLGTKGEKVEGHKEFAVSQVAFNKFGERRCRRDGEKMVLLHN